MLLNSKDELNGENDRMRYDGIYFLHVYRFYDENIIASLHFYRKNFETS